MGFPGVCSAHVITAHLIACPIILAPNAIPLRFSVYAPLLTLCCLAGLNIGVVRGFPVTDSATVGLVLCRLLACDVDVDGVSHRLPINEMLLKL